MCGICRYVSLGTAWIGNLGLTGGGEERAGLGEGGMEFRGNGRMRRGGITCTFVTCLTFL